MGPEPPPLSGHESVYVLNRGHQLRGSARCVRELKQLTPPAAESVTTRSVPYLLGYASGRQPGGRPRFWRRPITSPHFYPPMQRRKLWHLWAKALGEKTGRTTSEADQVAAIRSVIFVTYFLTNCFIVAGVIRHWNN